MNPLENAVNFLRSNKLPFWVVKKGSSGGNFVAKSSETAEEGESKADPKEVDQELSIAFFIEQMSYHPDGTYVLIGRRKHKDHAGALHFTFSKASDKPAAVGNAAGVLSEGRVAELIQAKLDAMEARHTQQMELFKKDQEIKELKKQLKEKGTGGIDIDKGLAAIQGIKDLILLSNNPGAAVAGTPRVIPVQPSTPAGGVPADELTPTQRVQIAIQKLESVAGPDLVPGLEGLAKLAETQPQMFLSTLNNVKNL